MNPLKPVSIKYSDPMIVTSAKHEDQITKIEATITYEDRVFTVTLKHRLGPEDDIKKIFESNFHSINRAELEKLDGIKFKTTKNSDDILQAPLRKESDSKRNYTVFERSDLHNSDIPEIKAKLRVQHFFDRLYHKVNDLGDPAKQTSPLPSPDGPASAKSVPVPEKRERRDNAGATSELSVQSTPVKTGSSKQPTFRKAEEDDGTEFHLREVEKPGLFSRFTNWLSGASKSPGSTDEVTLHFEEYDENVSDKADESDVEDFESVDSESSHLPDVDEEEFVSVKSDPDVESLVSDFDQVEDFSHLEDVVVPLIERQTEEIPLPDGRGILFDLYKIRGEGHCLFRAIAAGLLFELKNKENFHHTSLLIRKIDEGDFYKKNEVANIFETIVVKAPEEIIGDQTLSDLLVEWLRWLACEHNQAHKDEVDYQHTFSEEQLGKEPDQYFRDMKDMSKNEYGGSPEINALCNELMVEIPIYTSSLYDQDRSDIKIFLLLKGLHYDLLVKKKLKPIPIVETDVDIIGFDFPTDGEAEFRTTMTDYYFSPVSKKNKKRIIALNSELERLIKTHQFEEANKLIDENGDILHRYRDKPNK